MNEAVLPADGQSDVWTQQHVSDVLDTIATAMERSLIQQPPQTDRVLEILRGYEKKEDSFRMQLRGRADDLLQKHLGKTLNQFQ
ncbi:MAG: hypothetical protein AAF581_06630 [Planctomycetota bacterium]